MTRSRNMLRPALASTALLLLTACGTEQLGTNQNSHSFGQASHNNLLLQAAYLEQGSILRDLADEFERDVEGTVLFRFNSATLDTQARQILDAQSRWLKANPKALMQITGHADAVGTDVYNIELGQRRAETVLRYLVAKGVSESRLDAISSLGENDLVVDVEVAERQNRRSVTTVVGIIYEFVGEGFDGIRAHKIYSDFVDGSGPTLNGTGGEGGAGGGGEGG